MNKSLIVCDTNQIFVGIDGGGTKCRARVESATGGIVGVGMGGPANPSLGMERTVSSIIEATRAALADADLEEETMDKLIAGVGIAGLHLPRYFEAMQAWRHPFRNMLLFDDVYTACLGAHQGGDGAVIIAGTGFSALSIADGRSLTVGGHGFLLGGDQCSGSWIGFEAVKAVLLSQDGLGAATVLADMLENKFSARGLLLADALVGAIPRDYAALAPLVFSAAERGDTVAVGILRHAAAFIGRVVNILLEARPPRLSLIGGITGPISAWLDPQTAAAISPPLAQPEQGAIYSARKRCTNPC
ncbi:MAG: BadF/BadG/BcrA/BcrD ATPase family protein [Exilibacterium sp.]